jgi:hypothetical protein
VCRGYSLEIKQNFPDPATGISITDFFRLIAFGDDGVRYVLDPDTISEFEDLIVTLLDRISEQRTLPGWVFQGQLSPQAGGGIITG